MARNSEPLYQDSRVKREDELEGNRGTVNKQTIIRKERLIHFHETL